MTTASAHPVFVEGELADDLSRWLWLVKWWLLAIPHYIVVGFFHGGSGGYGGLTSVLAIFGAVAVLFRQPYPRDIFELILGFNRWSIRVAAYALLVRNEYPPFRLSP